MKKSLLVFISIFCLLNFSQAIGQDLSTQANKNNPQEKVELSDGTIQKIDWINHTLLVKHGPLKNMRLPAMTMLFKVQDEKAMRGLKVGDDILFIAEGNMRIVYLEKKK